VFDNVPQLGRDLVVDLQLTGIDDAHGQAGFNCVEQEHRVNGFTHRVVATERERHVRHATRGEGVGKVVADISTGLDEIDGVVIVLLDTGGDGKNVWIKDDVFRREAHLVDQDVVGAFA